MRWPWQRTPTDEPSEILASAWPEHIYDDPEPEREQLTGAAMSGEDIPSKRAVLPQNDAWQREIWEYYETGGEFGFAVSWKASMISQVRLRGAVHVPEADEPELLTEENEAEHGVAAGIVQSLVKELCGGVTGASDIMNDLAVHLNVPGECWLVGTEKPDGSTKWGIYSNDDVRVSGGDQYEVADDRYSTAQHWIPAEDKFVKRIWRRNKRFRQQADSPGRRMRGALRELELVNRAIQARYLSRLASAGIVIFPKEMSFPVRRQFENEPDPFLADWIDATTTAIQTPGSARAVAPIPIRVPAEYMDKVKFIDFTTAEDQKLLEKRESAIRRLAAQVDVPAEILLGMSDLNHWTAWNVQEDAIRAHIKPDVELIVSALTESYLWPRLQAAGVEDFHKFVIWFDASEITARPDRSDEMLRLYDRLELSGEALRRYTGADESDKPEDDDLKDQILKKIALEPTLAEAVISELTGQQTDLEREGLAQQGEPADPGPNSAEDDIEREAREAPGTTREEPAETVNRERFKFMITQSVETHQVTIKNGDITVLSHPSLCEPRLGSCPFTHAVRHGNYRALPGTTGSYKATMNGVGLLSIGERTYESKNMIDTPVNPKVGA